MATVGIIANPASGKDIRRLVAYGTVFDNQEKVNIVRRILLGLAANEVDRVFYMPDYYGIVPKAVEGLGSDEHLPFETFPVKIPFTGTQTDSLEAALAMREKGVDCIITLGGDGTNRMVAKGCGEIPLLPVSTGTNNVFPIMVEGTVAGLAAGAAAKGLAKNSRAIHSTKKITVYKKGIEVDMALIDAMVLDDCFIGSRAVWAVNRMKQAVVTRGEPHNIGISSIAGNLKPLNQVEPKGLCMEFGEGPYTVMAPIAPGLIRPIKIKQYTTMEVGDIVQVIQTPSVIALDGEREVEVKKGEETYLRLTFDGPNVIDVKQTLVEAVELGYFSHQAAGK